MLTVNVFLSHKIIHTLLFVLLKVSQITHNFTAAVGDFSVGEKLNINNLMANQARFLPAARDADDTDLFHMQKL